MRSCAGFSRGLLRRGAPQQVAVTAAAVPPPPHSGHRGGQKPPRSGQQPPSTLHPGSALPPAAAAHDGRRNTPFWLAATRVAGRPRAIAAAAAAAATAAPGPSGSVKPGADGRTAPPLRLRCAVHYLPHPEKRATGGEDASFVSADGLSAGVADGVGGWAEVGVDSGVYARLLMAHAAQAAGRLVPPAEDEEPGGAPLAVLMAAHRATRVAGGSTALILVLRQATLQTANLGDSGFMVLRAGKQLYRSTPQQFAWNAPNQLAAGRGGDRPTSADLVALAVQPGDVVVAATDGLWDNLFDPEVAAIVASELAAGRGVEGAAKVLAEAATARGAMTHADTPFSRGAQAARMPFRGGKEDDVTVLCAVVEAA